MRRAAKKDAIQPTAEKLWQAAGWGHLDLSQLGKSKPDALVARGVVGVLIEYKTPRGRKTAADRLADGQVAFARLWPGGVLVLQTADEVVRAIESLNRVFARTVSAGISQREGA